MIRIELVNDRIDQIRSSVHRLEGLSRLQLDEFVSDPDNFAIAEHHLRRAPSRYRATYSSQRRLR